MRATASLRLHRTADVAAGPGETSSPSSLPLPASSEQQTAPAATAVDANMVVILASLLCAMVCVLELVSRCPCRRRRTSSPDPSPPPPKGLTKKAIAALPTVSFAAPSPPGSSSPESVAPGWCSSPECAICLAEFADRESVRVLPRCGHSFHVACVDAWLRTCATCPSCRAAIVTVEPTNSVLAPTAVVVVAGGGSRCGWCGEVAAPDSGRGNATFLP
ncbi:hypothetical protein ACQ4PT_065701 [Festuca glaucescens]